MINGIQALKGKVILKYSFEDRETANFHNGIFIDPRWREGEFQPEIAEVLSIGENVHGIKKGERVIVSYHIAYDQRSKPQENQGNMGDAQRNAYFIEKDELGNEYRYCRAEDIYGKQIKGQYLPVQGWIFCYDLEVEFEKSKSGIYLLPEKQDTDNKAFKTKIKNIHPDDAKEYGLSENSIIFAEKKMDFKFRVGRNRTEIIAVPIHKVLLTF